MSPQYHSASCSEYAGGDGQLLFMVEDTGFDDLAGRAVRKYIINIKNKRKTV